MKNRNNFLQYDSEVEEQALQEYKHSRLDSLEARWQAHKEEDPGYYATSYSSWLNYGTSLVTNIIENLQLNIKDVHLRYEDDVTFSHGKRFLFIIIQIRDSNFISENYSTRVTVNLFGPLFLNFIYLNLILK